MNIVEMVRTSDEVQRKALAEMIEAINSNDSARLSKALKVGTVAAYVVKKGSAIAENAERYQSASNDLDECKRMSSSVLVSSDKLAVAEHITRLSSAKRRASALTKVEAQFGRLI